MHTCQKSQLTEINQAQVDMPERAHEGEVIIVDGSAMMTLYRFIVLVYDRSNAATGVDEVRLHMFAREHCPYDSIPPTISDLREHTKRAAYQAGVI